MNIISRYVFKRFSLNLFFCTLSMLVIYIVIDYIGTMKRYSEVSFFTTAYYYLFSIPLILNLIFSIILLLTSMFTMGSLAKSNEITAMRSAGLSIYRITKPVIFFSFFLTLLNIGFNETLLPKINRVKDNIYKTIIKKEKLFSKVSRSGFLYIGKNGIIYNFNGTYETTTKCGNNVSIEFYNNEKLYKKITCEKFRWDKDHWKAENGIERTFSKDSILTKKFSLLEKFPVKILERPEDILSKKLRPDEMNFIELNQYIESLKRAGKDPLKISKLRADLQFKISLPFISFILVLFGVALTVRTGRSGLAKVFGIGIIVGFLYYFLVHLGLGLGRSGTVNPVLGAWLGNLVFFPISLAFFIKVSKFE